MRSATYSTYLLGLSLLVLLSACRDAGGVDPDVVEGGDSGVDALRLTEDAGVDASRFDGRPAALVTAVEPVVVPSWVDADAQAAWRLQWAVDAPAFADLATGEVVRLDVGDVSWRGTVLLHSRNALGIDALSLRLEEGGLAFLVQKQGHLHGTLEPAGDGPRWWIRTDAQGQLYALALPVDALQPIACGGGLPVPDAIVPPARVPPVHGEDRLRPKARYGGWQSTRDGVVPVDILMVYTPAAAAWGAENESPIAYIASESVLRTNTALQLSDVEMRIDLVGLEEVAYTEASNSVRDLYRITENEDFNPGGNAGDVGFLREVHTWRDELAADLVVFLTRTEDAGGLGWVADSPAASFEAYGFSLVRVQQASWTYTVAHEIAHNMGAVHSRLQSDQAAGADGGMNPWATGWRWHGTNGRRTSVMTYEGRWQGEDWLPTAHFSNPDVLEGGEPTGVASIGDGGPADNARQLRDARGWIADFRVAHYVEIDATGPGEVSIESGLRLVDGETLEVVLTPDSRDVQVVNLQVNGVPRTPTTTLLFPSVSDDLRIEVVFAEVIRETAVIQFEDTEQVYNGTTRRVTVTTDPPGLPVTVRYNGSTSAPSQAGTYEVDALVDTPAYFGEAQTTLVVAPREATFTFSATDVLFNDRVQRPAVNTQPAGLPVAWETLEPAGVEPRDAGDYVLRARIDDPNHAGEAVVNFRIRPAPVIFAVSNLQQTYDGTPRLPTVTSTPAGVVPAFDWANGSAPINAGSWPFTVRSESGNWTGSLQRTLTIAPREATVQLSGLQKVWDGAPLPLQVTTEPPELQVVLTWNGETQTPTDAGSWTLRAQVDDPNHVGEATATATISPAPVAVEITGLAQDWTGQPRPVTVTTDPPDIDMRITYNGDETVPSRAGEWAVVAAPRSSNYTGRREATLTIQPVPVTITPLSTSRTWNGDPVPLVQYTVRPTGIATAFSWVDGEVPSDAGLYPFRIDITDGNGTGGFEGVYEIRRLAASVSLSDLERTWDGEPVPVTVTTNPSDLEVRVTYDGDEALPSGAGTFAVRAEITDRNRSGEATGSFVVERGTADLGLEGLEQVWSGEPRGVEVIGLPDGETATVTYDEETEPPSDAGSYAVRALVESNDWLGEVTGTLVVAPQPVTFEAADLVRVYDGTPARVRVTATPEDALFEVTYDGELNHPINVGAYAVVARTLDPNQTGSAEWELRVEPAPVSIAFDLVDQVADGLPKIVATSTEPPGVDLRITYDGDESAPSNAGTYAVRAEVTDPNYAGEATATLELRCPADACDTPGPERCSGNSPMVCEAQTWGCNLPRTLPACAGGRVCEEGVCVVPCDDACVGGDLRCAGQRPERCEVAASGCTEWVRQAACSAGQVCDAGTCVEACGDGCDEGSRRCNEDGVAELCGFDDEGCLRYEVQRACAASAICDDGRCVPRPPGETPSEPGTPPDVESPPSGGGSGGGCSAAPATTPGPAGLLGLMIAFGMLLRRPRRRAR